MRTTFWRVAAADLIRPLTVSFALLALTFAMAPAFADGCFVFRWNKQKDINEPTQKAIILHDQGREDLILQVKYEGPAEDFGWLIPVPGKPEVRKGSMESFYELSRITQEHFRDGFMHEGFSVAKAGGKEESVRVIEIRTVGAYEVAILSSTDPFALSDWLAAHEFKFPKEKQSVLDQYIQKHWYFVAARINPSGSGFAVKNSASKPDRISSVTREKLASGELHPIIISFPSEKCIFPLAISSVNGTPSEISLYVISAKSLLSPLMYDRKLRAHKAEKDAWLKNRGDRLKSVDELKANFSSSSPLATRLNAEDPNDPPPASYFDRRTLEPPESEAMPEPDDDSFLPLTPLVQSMVIWGETNTLRACRRDLPRLGGKQWWLTKLVETFTSEEMVDLELSPAIEFLSERFRGDGGPAAGQCLAQYQLLALPTILPALKSSDATLKKRGLVVATETHDPRLIEPLLKLMEDQDPVIRRKACHAADGNWDARFVEPLLELIRDPDPVVASTARSTLYPPDRTAHIDAERLRRMLAEDGPASAFALRLLELRGERFSKTETLHLLTYTNLATVSMVFHRAQSDLEPIDLTVLTTNALPIARLMALGALKKIGNRAAVDAVVSMLHDSNEGLRWRVRSCFRQLTGQKLGADSAAYEKWWAENRENYTTRPASTLSRRSP